MEANMPPDSPAFPTSGTSLSEDSSSSRADYRPAGFSQRFVGDYYRPWELRNAQIEFYVVRHLPLPTSLLALRRLRAAGGSVVSSTANDVGPRNSTIGVASGAADSLNGRSRADNQPSRKSLIIENVEESTEPPAAHGQIPSPAPPEEIEEAIAPAALESSYSALSCDEDGEDLIYERPVENEPSGVVAVPQAQKARLRTLKVQHSGELCDDEFEGYYNVRPREKGCCF